MITITLDPQGDSVTLTLTAYLGGDRFSAYRDACASCGARYVPSQRCNRASLSAVPALLRELSAAGLPFAVSPELAERIKEEATEAQAALEAGRARCEEARRRLEPAGLSLYRYQETGVEWLAPRTRALLADEMGLGKTVQALISLPEQAAALVVVPSGVRASWEREVARWRPDLKSIVVKSKTTFRWPRRGEVLLVSYGCLPPAGRDLPGVPEVGTVLCADEAHALKNPKAARTKAFRALVEHVTSHQGKAWGITGTPLLNRPPELWAVLQSFGLANDAFGGWHNFVSSFHGRRGRFGYEWGKPDERVPDLLRKVALRRRRLEVLKDLPRKRRVDRSVNSLDSDTIQLCDEALAALREAGIDLEQSAETAELTRISGAAFSQLSAARAALAAAKIPTLLELVESYEDAEEPLVVFSAHRAPVEALRAREGWAVILGDTSPDERGRIVERFQRGELRGVAGTIQAMGVGVTLTRASHVLLVDLAWTPALNAQAEDRCCRIGQEADSVLVERLIARHAIDERVVELLTAKQVVIDGSVEASSVEEDYTGTSPAAELADVAHGLDSAVAAGAEAARKAEEERARKQAEYDAKFRPARGPVEEHAQAALLRLAALDPDHARAENGVGFSKFDNAFGHSLAEALEARGRLSDKQWTAAVRLAARYHRQVGPAPREG